MRTYSNKFSAHRINHLGRSFASKLEASLYDLLLLRERAGEIEDIRCQDTIDLVANVRWRVDYSARHKLSGDRLYFEAKGIETEDYKIKLKLFRVFGPGKLEIWKGSYTKPVLTEVIIPEGKRMNQVEELEAEIKALREKLQQLESEIKASIVPYNPMMDRVIAEDAQVKKNST